MARAQQGDAAGGAAGGAAQQGPQQPGPPAPSYKYKYCGSVQEDHREPLYCAAFAPASLFHTEHRDVFATVGGHRATIYRLLPSGLCEVLQVYEDGDRGRKGSGGGAADPDSGSGEGERWFCCKWSIDPGSGAALLLVAGQKALVRVLDVSRGGLVHTFAGHGKGINDIAVHPDRPHLFLTASDDESVRLWNLRSGTCVAIFAGEGGHRNKVLSLDFHPWDGHRFLSSGMDNAVKIWSLAQIEPLIEESDRAQGGCIGGGSGGEPKRAFPTRIVQQPLFSTLRVHNDYVDCVRWLGDLVLSKSVHDAITLWRPHGQAQHRRPPPGRAAADGAPAGESGAGGAAAGAAAAAGERGGGEDSEEEGEVGLSATGRLGGESVASRATKIVSFALAESLRTWFVRFATDTRQTVMACGNARGKVFVFAPRVSAAGVGGAPRAKLTAPQCKAVVRQTAVSWDGGTILAACDDGSLHRWDRDSGDAAMEAA